MKKLKPLYLAYHNTAKAYYNPIRINQNKLDYEVPKFYLNINALVGGIRKLENYNNLSSWSFFETDIKLTKIEIKDVLEI